MRPRISAACSIRRFERGGYPSIACNRSPAIYRTH
jgi:hypothetical protein